MTALPGRRTYTPPRSSPGKQVAMSAPQPGPAETPPGISSGEQRSRLQVVPPLDERDESGAPPSPFRSAPPVVTLLREESTSHPVALAIAAAWSCYAARPGKVANVLKLLHGPVPPDLTPEAAADREDRRDKALKLYADLFAAGHHTTMQHATFIFVLDNVSRLALWSFFHSHPFYNSEQVSQRYREVSGAVMTTPALPERQLAIYQSAIERSLEGYRRLTDILTPDFQRDY